LLWSDSQAHSFVVVGEASKLLEKEMQAMEVSLQQKVATIATFQGNGLICIIIEIPKWIVKDGQTMWSSSGLIKPT